MPFSYSYSLVYFFLQKWSLSFKSKAKCLDIKSERVIECCMPEAELQAKTTFRTINGFLSATSFIQKLAFPVEGLV